MNENQTNEKQPKTVTVKLRRNHTHAGVVYKAGDTIQVSEGDAELITKMHDDLDKQAKARDKSKPQPEAAKQVVGASVKVPDAAGATAAAQGLGNGKP